MPAAPTSVERPARKQTPRRPLHPATTHTPIGGIVACAAFDLISVVDGGDHSWARDLYRAGTFVLMVATAVMVPAVLSGLADRKTAAPKGSALRGRVGVHARLMGALTVAAGVDVAFRLGRYADAGHTPGWPARPHPRSPRHHGRRRRTRGAPHLPGRRQCGFPGRRRLTMPTAPAPVPQIVESVVGIPDRHLQTVDLVSWIAAHSTLSFEDAYRDVCGTVGALEREPFALGAARQHVRSRLSRSEVAAALAAYYQPQSGEFYTARVGDAQLQTSVLSRPEWLESTVRLDSDAERLTLNDPPEHHQVRLDELGLRSAISRLAAVELGQTVMVNNPLYRLLDVDLGADRLSGTFGLTDFASYG